MLCSPSHIEFLAVADNLKQLIASLFAVASVQEVSEWNWPLCSADDMHDLTLCPPTTGQRSVTFHLIATVCVHCKLETVSVHVMKKQ